jgi:hypothetical protein
MREVNDAAVIEALGLCFKLTAREAEVLYWVIKGKTNKDIGDILGSSPASQETPGAHLREDGGGDTHGGSRDGDGADPAAAPAVRRVREADG